MNAVETPNILIVEDEKIVAWDIQERLESLGYTIVAKATSGEAAIAAANQIKPDLVLMDIQLQGEMDGIEAAQVIYRNCNIPVVYLTAHSDDQTLAVATRSNPFGYLLKPFQARELHSTIQVALHRHAQEMLAHQANHDNQLWKHNQQLEQFQSNLLNQVSAQTSQFEQLSTYSQILVELLDEKLLPPGQPQRFNDLLQYLGELLDLDYGWIARYDEAHSQAIVIDQYQPEHRPNCRQRTAIVDRSIVFADSPDFYQLLFLGISWVDPLMTLLPPAYAAIVQPQDQVLVCPIIAKQVAGQLPVIIGEVGLITTGQSAWNTPLQLKLITQIVSYAASISRQAELEAITQSQKLDLASLTYQQENFISSISHELKTPLENMHRAIQKAKTLAHTMESLTISTIDSRRHQSQLKQHLINQLEVLEAECRSESDLVNDLLNFQSPPIPIATSAMSQVPIDYLITEIVEQLNVPASRFHQEWCYAVEPATLQVFSHRASLYRIIKELLHNAVKYTPPHQQIRISAQLIDHTFELRIMNTGITIAPDELVQIFQPFYRIPRDNPWDYCGMGLGLALVQKLTHQIGGNIIAESSEPGTTFILSLPQASP